MKYMVILSRILRTFGELAHNNHLLTGMIKIDGKYTKKSIISFANEGIESKWNGDGDDDDDDTRVIHSIYSVRNKIHTLRWGGKEVEKSVTVLFLTFFI